jgi:hypothetical protein
LQRSESALLASDLGHLATHACRSPKLHQIEVLGHLSDRAVTLPATLHDLGVEVRRERSVGTRLSSSPQSPFWTSFPGLRPTWWGSVKPCQPRMGLRLRRRKPL